VKKICLITPSSPFLSDERVFYFIGILKVAAAWEKLGYKIDCIDLCGVANPNDVLNDYFSSNKDLHFVGVTATSPQYPNAHHLAEHIRQNWPELKLVIGGTHATLSHTSMKREQSKGVVNGRARRAVDQIMRAFDVLVAGDGELLLPQILEAKSGDVIDADDRKSPYFLNDAGLDESPWPARHLIDIDGYNYTIDGVKATNVILQYGCPYKCTFCSGRNSPSLRVIRTRTTANAVAELEFLYKEYGFRGFNFFDDELNVNKEMVPLMNSIADLQEKLGVEFKLRGFTKSELFNEEQAKAMYRAGFRMLLTGFESGDARILQNIKKNATLDDNTRCVEIAKKYNLKVKALMSAGHPGESPESIENTKKWLLDVRPEEFDLTVISPYPGSPVYDDAVLEGDHYVYRDSKNGDALYQKEIDYTKEANYYKSTPGSYVSYVWTDHISSEDLVKTRDKIEDEVRTHLGIPFNRVDPAKKYEHSMGSSANLLPDWILRSTETHKPKTKEKPKKTSLKVLK
jgi:anaerobic magnesium-protoporphyrin IX monomethyl ester cyclase